MNNDFLEVRNAEGMPNLVDSTIALDFLLSAKTGVRTCAIALSEAATTEVRNVLRSQLETSLNLYEEISELMLRKGWLHPYNLQEQVHMDMISSKTASQIASFNLFPGNTSRLGTFATPEK